MVADLAASFAGSACAGELLGAQEQNLFQRLMPDFIDHGLHHLAGILDQVDDGEQDLPVGLQNCSMTAADSRAARVTM